MCFVILVVALLVDFISWVLSRFETLYNRFLKTFKNEIKNRNEKGGMPINKELINELDLDLSA